MSETFQSLFVDGVNREHYKALSSASNNVQVVVWPTYSGLTDFEKGIADKIAAMGFTATAVDLYGQDRNPVEVEDKRSVMMSLISDEASLHDLQSRLTASATTEGQTIIHVGFCLGGRLALEAGLHLSDSSAAVSFHGLMSFYRAEADKANAKAKILVMNGYQDPMVSDEDAVAAKQYWSDLGMDWQFIDFGNTMHSFMLPGANNPDHGQQYNPVVAARGYQYLEHFLNEFV